ncbi:peptidoglycan-associated lipoprotein [Thioploca ingrica]|uniref:Peptidoglycan-associated lipoprotein n=1 Tax=Thioploca ingrica TaxID=40754 RepID=A0A090AI68_9GAMM|nr:peptidoglycan-associated lipoprotein [Thioploca ingrica]
MNKLGYLVLILVTVIAFSGCSSKPKKPTAPPGTAGVLGGDGSQTNLEGSGGAGSETTGGGLSGTTGGGSMPSERVIHFDYDMSDIRPEARAILEQNATYLSGNPNTQVRLEGHADERGSREYNLALGERRAESAKGALMSLGVSGNQITTLSYGEEQPVALGHNEHDWQLNRRVEIIYP